MSDKLASWRRLPDLANNHRLAEAVAWVASIAAGGDTGPDLGARFDPILLRFIPARQLVREIRSLGTLTLPFAVDSVETSDNLMTAIFTTADGLKMRFRCSVTSDGPARISHVRAHWLGLEQLALDSLEDLDRHLRRHRVPGLSVAWIDRDGSIVAKSWGDRSAQQRSPMDADTPLHAGSISKLATAVAALRLVDQGQLNLDDDARTRLHRWDQGGDHADAPITLRQLLSHSAGMPVWNFYGYFPGESTCDLVAVLRGDDPDYEPVRLWAAPGSQVAYSNAGFAVVQLLLEDVTGQPFDALMTQLVLKPLGMTASTFSQPPPDSVLRRMASGHDQVGVPLFAPDEAPITPGLAFGGLVTTPTDLCRLAVGIQQSLAGDPDSILSADIVTEMLKPGLDQGVGLGVMVDGQSEPPLFSHLGGSYGYGASLTATQAPGLAVAVMTNRHYGSTLLRSVRNLVASKRGYTSFEVSEASLRAATNEFMAAVAGGRVA